MMEKFYRAYACPEQQKRIRAEYAAKLEADPNCFAEFGVFTMEHVDQVLTLGSEEIWKNDKYQVAVHRNDGVRPGWQKVIHLSIKRLDKEPIRDWREMQEIKNELVGPENEGVELYPAESRLVDLANQFHLWVLADSKIWFPFGFDSRHVDDQELAGSKQRKRGDA